ncbi:hypothetical protein BC939DRAFT_458562 [Gamsiella multidivaricata]|uniref:uncharacterized protein n=1 Tax=Gamsiella multidivaricata TaxID=101098 RepID=UPI002220C617|nr:uncharacterized protein BC939DRAFT_458562 [Gamsiella multidivaricata]KAI7820183.1 hypothetical protein BC939DRAFT_458562 [Gamsiella multidivaricata]
MLFKIALKNLHDVQRMNRIPSFDKGRCLQYKDAFVALSGIWNLFSQNASDHFDPAQSKEAQDLCLLPHLDAKIPGIDLIVQPLIDKLNDGSSLQELLEHTYKLQYELPAQRLNLRVLQTILMHVIRPLTGPKALSEADALLLWASVFKDGLPLDTALSLHLGDQGCAATTLSKSALAEAFDTDNATRKCDCILAVDGLEVGNFEAKRESSSSIDIAIQMRKNAKINKSILLELEKYGLECPPILNIQGMTATVSKITRYQDIWVLGMACPTLALPRTGAHVRFFLEKDVYVLFRLLNNYHSYAQNAFLAKQRYEYHNQTLAQEAAESAYPKEGLATMEWERVVLHSPSKPVTAKENG